MTTSIREPDMDCSGHGGCWTSLPAEVRVMILREIVRQKFRGWASCAAVCKEWQAVIEPKNFQRLTLRKNCIPELEDITIRPRRFVQHICLNVEFPRYTCSSWSSCKQQVLRYEFTAQSLRFRRLLIDLLSVLRCWRLSCPLTLELNAYSPSDSEHWFKIDRFGLENEDLILQKDTASTWHDPGHGWVDGRQVEAPGKSAILRLFAPLLFFGPVPLQVHSVTGLVVRRQMRRQIWPRCLKAILEILPQLETLVYEPWRVWQREGRDEWYEGRLPHAILFSHLLVLMTSTDLAHTIQHSALHQLKRVSVFEDFNDRLALALENDTEGYTPVETGPAACPLLAAAFVSKSYGLEHLSLSYIVDTQRFFDACQPSNTWHHLQSLALTSSVLKEAAPLAPISSLLRDVSLAASRMPQLENLVIWNYQHGGIGAVIYHRDNAARQATLTWRGTWDLDFGYDVVESWEEVDSNSCLQVEKEILVGAFNSHGDAICHLHLPVRVIDPISLRQICQEGMMQAIV